jgi:hypothetical protein
LQTHFSDLQVAEILPKLVVQSEMNIHELGQLVCIQPVNALDWRG